MKKLIIIAIWLTVTQNSIAQIIATDNSDIQIYPSSVGQHEVHISINKTNPLNLIVSSNVSIKGQQGHYFSIDGGITWNGADNLPNSGGGSGDPSTSFDAEGRGYITTMTPAGDGYFVQNSVTSGFTWSSQKRGSGPTGGFDKEMIATVDEMQTSPYANNFYCAWTDFNNSGGRVTVNRSTDLTATFANQTVLSSSFGQGTNVQTGPNGEVYVCWANGGVPANKMGFASSMDGGVNYTSTLPFSYSGIRKSNGSNGNFGNIRVNDFPSMAVDKSCGVNRGRIYIVYPEFERDAQGNLTSKSIINLKFSDDKGASWSSTKSISISNGRQNWLPWIAVDDLTGLVTIIYYSLDQSTGNSTNTYVAYSTDGSIWQNLKVSDASHNTAPIPSPSSFTFAQGYAGDYIGITAFNGSAYCAWMDDRSGVWQVYVSRVDFNLPSLTSSQTNLEINNPSTIRGSQNFQASQKIRVANTSSVNIASNAIVEMVAGESIELKPGFSTITGATYVAKIEQRTPCTTPGAISFKKSPINWENEFNIVKEETEGVKLFAYPNPTTDYITIGALNNQFKSINLIITDLQGKLIQEYHTLNKTPEQIRQIINVSTYPKGTYIATLNIDKKSYSLKFNKE